MKTIRVSLLAWYAASLFAQSDSALVEASARRDRVAALALIANGANVEARNRDGDSPLGLWSCAGDVTVVRALLQKHARVDGPGEYGLTPLMLAAQCKQPAIQQMLIAAGADPKLQDRLGFTYAIYRDVAREMVGYYLNAMQMLQKAGPKVQPSRRLSDPEAQLQFEMALFSQRQMLDLAREFSDKTVRAAGKHAAVVEENLRAAFDRLGHPYYRPGSIPGPDGAQSNSAPIPARTAGAPVSIGQSLAPGQSLKELMALLYQCDVDSARELLVRTPAVAAAIRKDGHEALTTAVSGINYGKCSLEAATFLLEHGAQPNQRTASGLTALTVLVAQQRRDPRAPQLPMLDVLLKAGANPNQRDSFVGLDSNTRLRGETPLFYAALSLDTSKTKEDVRQRLIQSGADTRMEKAYRRFARTDFRCEDMVALAASGTPKDIEDFMRRERQTLGECPTGQATSLNDNLSPLLAAVLMARTDSVQFLVEAGADVNAQTPAGVSGLMLASALGAAPTIDLLKKLGGNPALRDVQNRDAEAWGSSARLKEITRNLAGAMTSYAQLGPLIKTKARQENSKIKAIREQEMRKAAIDAITGGSGQRYQENDYEYGQRVSEEHARIAAAASQRTGQRIEEVLSASSVDQLEARLKGSYQNLFISVRCGLLTTTEAREDLGVTFDLMGLVPQLSDNFRHFYQDAEYNGDTTNCQARRPR
jgi:ankyrin repeat protein